MPKVTAVGTAVPPHALTQESTREYAGQHFSRGIRDIQRLISVFDNVQIRRRFFCVPLDWFGHDHNFSERNDLYIEWAEKLSLESARSCLQKAKLEPGQIDHLVFVSTSGMSTPSIDARLINRLGFGKHIRRTPIFGLGCAGGAAGLSRCWELTKGSPRQRILLVAVELSSLTFQCNDFSKSNLVASALFADGAAAAVISGDELGDGGVEIVDTQSTIWPQTLDVMGWNFSQTGLQVIFSRSIPHLLKQHIKHNIERLLSLHKLSLESISHYVIHPGGAKVLQSFEESLGLTNGLLDNSRWILENYGNMSSPTMLFILDRLLCSRKARPGEYGISAAFGPGFSSELLLLRWGAAQL